MHVDTKVILNLVAVDRSSGFKVVEVVDKYVHIHSSRKKILHINSSRLVFILAGAVCVIWEFAPVQTYACVGLYLISTVT